MRASFGGCDVSAKLASLHQPFEVNIRLFGDPKPGTYKFLTIRDEDGHGAVMVGENDIVWNLKSAIREPPPCRVLAPLDKFVRHKNGICLENITSCQTPLIISKMASTAAVIRSLDELDEVKTDSCDFVFCSDWLLCVPNPLALLCALHGALREGGHCILTIPLATQAAKTEKETMAAFEKWLQVFDAKTPNTHLDVTQAANNKTTDFNALRAMLSFAALNPRYVQRHEERQVVVARKLTIVPSPQSTNSNGKFFDKSQFPSDVMFCPHCRELFCKDERCSFVFCGLGGDDVFRVGFGCGKSFCYTCGKKYCGQHYDPKNGDRLTSFRDKHDATCCRNEKGFQMDDYCPGGHSAHCSARW